MAFLDDSERYLPAGTSGRSMLGAVDVDNKGMSGLESEYDQLLTGTPGKLTLEKNPQGDTIAVGDHTLVPAVPGQNLTLTIDRAIQYEAETALADQVRASEAKGGIAIVTKPGTGEVLAMANVVTDPETGEVVDRHQQRGAHHPVRAGLGHEDGHRRRRPRAGRRRARRTQFYLPPVLQVYDAQIGEAEDRGAVTWDVAKILEQSSNVGTVKIAQAVGARRHVRVPEGVRLRREDRPRLPERGPRRGARAVEVVRHVAARPSPSARASRSRRCRS